MQPERLHVKLFAEGDARPTHDAVIGVLHGIIQQRALDETLIDVTDYAHVAGGPGVLLIAHAANYGLGDDFGRYGLLYARKRDAAGTLEERLVDALRRTLAAAERLESALGGSLRFSRRELRVAVPDRLRVPNDDASFAAVAPALAAAIGAVFPGATPTITRAGEPREALGLHARLEG
jgi:hypothetical protein